MRGGRFQQKNTEDASIRNAEALFESRSVAEIREVEAHTLKEIEEKKEELRQLVGESYRDLIESADSIVSMKNSCENVSVNIRRMEDGFKYLKEGVSVQPGPPDVDKEKKKREILYGIGSRVKYIVDTPEKIWGFLDEHMYLEGAQRYFRAREVYTLLTEAEVKAEKKELLAHFPLLRHQWPLVETFRGQISQRSRDRLLEPGLGVREYAVALAAVAVIDELKPFQILSLFFETRRARLRAHLRLVMAGKDRGVRDMAADKVVKKIENQQTASVNSENSQQSNNVDGEASSCTTEVATVFCKAANMIQVSLCHVGELFLEVHGDSPLFFRTILNSPPGSQLFGGIPNPEEEVQLWKRHWEKLENTMVPLSTKFISEACLSWIRTCENDLALEGKALLELVERAKDLAQVEQLVREMLDNHDALGGSMQWLQSAFGQAVDSPWRCVSALLLKEPIDMWDTLFEHTFVRRVKGIIDSGLSQIDIESMVDDYLSAIGLPCQEYVQHGRAGLHRTHLSFQMLGLCYSNSRVFAGMQQDPRLTEGPEGLTGCGIKLPEDDKQRFWVSNSYLGREITQVKDEIDQKLRSIFDDLTNFLQVQQNASRLQHIASYLQEQCFSHISTIIKMLQEKLVNIFEEINRLTGMGGKLSNLDNTRSNKSVRESAESSGMPVSGLVEKTLFLGRLFVALSHHSSSLKAILQSPKLWSFEERSMAGDDLKVLPHGKSWLNTDQASLESHGKWRLKTRVSSAVVVKDHEKTMFSKLESVLRLSSFVAYGMWVSWSTEELGELLTWDLQKDDDLSSSTPLKGWEETVIKQENEDGREIEMKLHLPAMPSHYVISLLFRGCQEIYRVGGHALDTTVLQLFCWKLLEKVLTVYEILCSDLKFLQNRVSENGLLQLLFDLHFLGDVMSSGQHITSESLAFLREGKIVNSLPTPLEFRIKQLLFQAETAGLSRKLLGSLLEKLSSRLDPIDWATFEPHLWENERQAYQRSAILFGFLVQLDRLYTDTVQKLPSNTDSSLLKVSATVPRFTYLPISTPSMIRTMTSNDESGGKIWKTYSNGRHSSKFNFDDDDSDFESALGARPLFRSIMNQVGSKFGEGTFKLGSMLSDGQVSRLKDRSAAAISTFGEILPAHAAGLFSSLTASATKSET